MLEKKKYKRIFAMFPAALYVAVSFAQTVRTLACDETDSVCTAALRPGYRIVFSDEFNGADGTLPDHRVWKNCKRHPSVTWARFLSSSPAVAFQEGGSLVLRAVPDPDRPTDEAAMLTGGIETSQSFSFRFGMVECRALVNPFIGNFPAVWMMPKTDLKWPLGGEIDIFEQINEEQKAYSTVHSAWTKIHPDEPHSGNVSLPMDRYHIYAVEWGENALTFYTDGRQVYQYTKQNDSQEQWPFDKSDFYLILNQSVGDGSWAEKPDSTHTYEMRIDWIRVYQREETVSKNVIVPVSGGSDSMKTYLLQVGGNVKETADCRKETVLKEGRSPSVDPYREMP